MYSSVHVCAISAGCCLPTMLGGVQQQGRMSAEGPLLPAAKPACFAAHWTARVGAHIVPKYLLVGLRLQVLPPSQPTCQQLTTC